MTALLRLKKTLDCGLHRRVKTSMRPPTCEAFDIQVLFVIHNHALTSLPMGFAYGKIGVALESACGPF
jgi:hypothetical protein